MNLTQFLSILKARWWVALLLLVLTVGTTLGVSLMLPKQYSATASIVIDVKPDPIAGQFAGMLSPSYMATQVDVIQSDRVARRVVRNLKLADNPQVRADWLETTGGKGDIEAWIAGRFKSQHGSQAIAREQCHPRRLQRTGSRICGRSCERIRAGLYRHGTGTPCRPRETVLHLLRRTGKEAREAFEKAQARVSAFQKEKGIIATDERLDIENARLSELSSQLVMIQALSSESGTRQAQAKGRVRRPHARGSEQRVDLQLEVRPFPQRGSPSGTECTVGGQPPASGRGQGEHQLLAQSP
jgi:polysaccharide biosynthesis transport protein